MTKTAAGRALPLDIGALAAMIQGEVLDLADACVVLADAAAPMDELSLAVQQEIRVDTGLITVPHPVDQVAMLTQTCDLQETTDEEHHCQVAPVLTRHPTFVREASRGHRPGYAALPWIGDDRVVDLSRITTLERAVVVDKPTVGRPRTSQERLDFAEAVNRHLTRVALEPEIVAVLHPFLRKIKARAGKDGDEGRCLGHVEEFRLEADPGLDDPSPALTVLVVIREENLPRLPHGVTVNDQRVDAVIGSGIAGACRAILTAKTEMALREAWTALAELWIKPAVEAAENEPRVGSIFAEVVNEEELTYGRSRRSPVLDLRYLSTRPA